MAEFNLLEHIRDNREDSIVVWLFNIGIEKYWNAGGAATIKDPLEDVVVNHIEEINLLITRKQDYIILRQKPDDIFLQKLQDMGFEIPNFLIPTSCDEEKSISEIVLRDADILQKLKMMTETKDVYFVPYGVSGLEEEIALKCGLRLIGGTNEKSRIVNNKIFSKQVAHDLNLPAAQDIVCNSINEIQDAYKCLIQEYSKIIIKMPCNSSGQGMWIVDSEAKLKMVCMIINRLMKRDSRNNQWLVEGWIEKKLDLNLQVYVSENGYVETFSVKEQIIEETLYLGSITPPRLSKQQYQECVTYGEQIGRYLFSLGFSGVFGIDALVDNYERIVPIIEINGRFTLSTYISFIMERYPDKYLYAFYKRGITNVPLDYQTVYGSLKENQMDFTGTRGIFAYNSATINSKLASGHFRFFCIAVDDDFQSTKELADKMLDMCEGYNMN